MYQYKVINLRIPFLKSEQKGANLIQDEMNKHAKDGWKVCKVNIFDLTLVYITFEKEI